MAISMASLRRGNERKPPRILLYGTHGQGKTSFAAGAPNPVFLQTEDGFGEIVADTFGLLKTYDEVVEAAAVLCNEEHDFQTVILDSMDWLEPMVQAEACEQNGWKNIEQPGFGKGYIAALDVWRTLMDGFNIMRDRGMTIIMLAHAEAKRFESPEVEAYDRYGPKLQKAASALIQEHVDCVWFLNQRVSIVRDDKKDSNSRARGVGGGQRVLCTAERPAYLAKNRYSMPDQITMPNDPAAMWPEVAKHIPFYTQPTKG